MCPKLIRILYDSITDYNILFLAAILASTSILSTTEISIYESVTTKNTNHQFLRSVKNTSSLLPRDVQLAQYISNVTNSN